MKKNDFLLSAPRAVRLMLMVLMSLPMWGVVCLWHRLLNPMLYLMKPVAY